MTTMFNAWDSACSAPRDYRRVDSSSGVVLELEFVPRRRIKRTKVQKNFRLPLSHITSNEYDGEEYVPGLGMGSD